MPIASVDVVKVAIPPLTFPVPSVAEPLRNVTVPDGSTPFPPPDTVAVRVMD